MDVTHYTHSVECDSLTVQYDLCYPGKSDNKKYSCDTLDIDANFSYEQRIATFEKAYGETLEEIGRLTNNADGLDYTVAVASGMIAGIIDLVWVGEFSISQANEWGINKVNNFVIWVAQKQGYAGNDLVGAVTCLEDKFSIAADKATNDFGGGKQHHLRDFSHHPTPVGLFFSLLTQFTGNVYGTDVTGAFKVAPLGADAFSLIGKNLPEKLTFGVINWFFHMISDMAASSSSIKEGKLGTGLPGPIVSLLKELSALPIFRSINKQGQKEFSVWVSKLFNGTLLSKRDPHGEIIELVKFDLRTEIGVAHELGRQAIPVIVNECVVRAFYFLRRLFNELKENNVGSITELNKINWKNTLPIKNRTIARMLTISTGTMETIDMVDAVLRSGGALPVFLLRVNFVGLGRFAIAGSTDVMMEIKKARLELAMTSAEAAKSALTLDTMMENIKSLQEQTQARVEQMRGVVTGMVSSKYDEIGGTPVAERQNYQIQIDQSIFTLDDAKAMAEQIFEQKNEEFQSILDTVWYQHFLKAVSIHVNGKKKIISNIISLSKIQQLFMKVYELNYRGVDQQLNSIIDSMLVLNQKFSRFRSSQLGYEAQEDIKCLSTDAAMILSLLLPQYQSQNGKNKELQDYRRAIAIVLGRKDLKGEFTFEQLEEDGIKKYHNIFCRCIYEMCAIDKCLEQDDVDDNKIPADIKNILDDLALGKKEKQRIKQDILRQANAFGDKYFYNGKYVLQSTEIDWDGIALVDADTSQNSEQGKIDLEWKKVQIRAGVTTLVCNSIDLYHPTTYTFQCEEEIAYAVKCGTCLDQDLIKASKTEDIFGGYDLNSLDGNESIYFFTTGIRIKSLDSKNFILYSEITSMEISRGSLKLLDKDGLLLAEIKQSQNISLKMLCAIRKFLLNNTPSYAPPSEYMIQEILKQRIQTFLKGTSATAYSCDDLLCFNKKIDKRLSNALHSYAKKVKKNEVLAFIDTSLFNSGKDGILFTAAGIAFNDAFEHVFVHYNEISCLKLEKHRLEIYGYFDELKQPMRGYPAGTPLSIPDIYFNIKSLKDGIEEIQLYAE